MQAALPEEYGMLGHSLKMFRPSTWKPAVAATRTLWFDYAHLHTVLNRTCVDAARQPVPWYTYPAIEYLKQLDFTDKTVFEYGSGNSTLFWASAARRVVSVEDNEAWHGSVRGRLPAHCELILEPDLTAYARVIDRYDDGFDVIVVDGAARGGTRLKCSRAAVSRLRRGGMIILDNSDWLPESARVLRGAGLIQVDMTGFAPISAHTQTTSLFLHRDFAFRPRAGRQPMPGPGAAPKVWEYTRSSRAPLVEIDDEAFGGVRRDEAFVLASPSGPRRFRLIVAEVTEGGPECAAILDVDRLRVLLLLDEPTRSDATAEAELARALSKPWHDFVGFVNGHAKRRYRLAG